ncbi:NADH:ubiquinone reductase (Na(+)-transporting) subunit B [Candidatus Marinamargulisbacteria bacterium SCGC AG-439-L15]|nr:NADH:ubiquinone reductase (Na(+)-transporting) subunit B [Candidatus Marinamargulisbacteria bacterium SCGC AG-439-L15]
MIKKVKAFLDSKEHLFEKGGKFEKLYPLYEAAHTIHFSPTTTTKKGPNIRDFLDTKRYMILVVIALIPCTLFGLYNAGYQSQLASGLSLGPLAVTLAGAKAFLPILLMSYAIGGIWEVIFAVTRKHEINEGFLVTGLLFPLTLPPTIPLWQVAIGISFGVVVGKELFGGTGKNFLNPALTARAFVYFSYPAYLSGEVWTFLQTGKDKLIDAYSGATPLAIAAITEAPNSAINALQSAGYSFEKLFWGLYQGSIGETSVFCILLGAGLLILTGIGSWRIMAGCVLGGVGMTLLFNAFAGPSVLPFLAVGPVWHLLFGSFAFGTVFMATDPVSAPDLNPSKWVYGILIGVLTIIIRVVNPAYPEGVMLAILLMNVFAPLIDAMMLKKRLKRRIPNVV